MTITSAMCAVGMHSWTRMKTDDGRWYLSCRRCGKDNDGIIAVRGAAGADNQAWPR